MTLQSGERIEKEIIAKAMHEARSERMNCIEIYTMSLREISASFEQRDCFSFFILRDNCNLYYGKTTTFERIVKKYGSYRICTCDCWMFADF